MGKDDLDLIKVNNDHDLFFTEDDRLRVFQKIKEKEVNKGDHKSGRWQFRKNSQKLVLISASILGVILFSSLLYLNINQNANPQTVQSPPSGEAPVVTQEDEIQDIRSKEDVEKKDLSNLSKEEVRELKKDPDQVVNAFLYSIENKDWKLQYEMYIEEDKNSLFENLSNPHWAEEGSSYEEVINLIVEKKTKKEAVYKFDVISLVEGKVIGKGEGVTLTLSHENGIWSIEYPIKGAKYVPIETSLETNEERD
ncbi:hypothetical protein [Halalkalibacter alkalisediminis]|uniref:Uncharacterized protein n=1 Tax=Halalkalibacter alkalisediminis TaxID=935616 RepID=A0ABV6NNH4_9BACI|nr:hypothetical protein [Halalkalibacter alkalisediminis]